MFSILALLMTPYLSVAERFSPPTGPYHVGITKHIFQHSTPNDPVAPQNASNILLATIYYPTLSTPWPNATAPYIDPILAGLYSGFLGIPNGTSPTQLKTWNQPDAPIFKKADHGISQLPTVILFPGGGGNGILYNFLSSELASRGYPVVALDHPGESPYLQLPGNISGVYGVGVDVPKWAGQFLFDVYHMRVSDALAVIRDLLPLYGESIGASWNTSHFLAVGHSLGGAAVAGAMAAEPSILGGVNFDGGFYDIVDAKRPYLMMAGTEHTPSLDNSWSIFSQNQSGWWEWVNVTDTGHMNYGDIGDWFDLLGVPKTTAWEFGSIWAPRMDHIVLEYVLRLFSVALGGPKDVFNFPDQDFPEVFYINSSSKAV